MALTSDLFQCEFYPAQYYYGTSVYFPRPSSLHTYDVETAYQRGRENAGMGNDRRFDLTRRFGSETTLSARSLAFNPPTERRRAPTPVTGPMDNVYTEVRSNGGVRSVPSFVSRFHNVVGDLDGASVVVDDCNRREMGVMRATSRTAKKANHQRNSTKERHGRVSRSNSGTT